MNQTILHSSVRQVIKNLRNKDVLLVYSPTTVDKSIAANLLSFGDLELCDSISISNNNLSRVSYDALRVDMGYEVYVGFGGGTAIDVAKFLSYNNKGSKCIVIPSMLSTNVFATNKVAAIRQDGKHTEDAKLPEEVVYDEALLNLSKTESLYGLADAFSICTALHDWQVADSWEKEAIHKEIYNRAEGILNDARELAKNPTNLGIFKVLQQAGYITNDYGSGRPESGSEHIIAKEIEHLVSVPHALAVTCGIAITSLLQNTYIPATKPLKQVGVFQQIRHSAITPEILNQALCKVHPREDRYTILDVEPISKDLIPSLISRSGLYD